MLGAIQIIKDMILPSRILTVKILRKNRAGGIEPLTSDHSYKATVMKNNRYGHKNRYIDHGTE